MSWKHAGVLFSAKSIQLQSAPAHCYLTNRLHQAKILFNNNNNKNEKVAVQLMMMFSAKSTQLPSAPAHCYLTHCLQQANILFNVYNNNNNIQVAFQLMMSQVYAGVLFSAKSRLLRTPAHCHLTNCLHQAKILLNSNCSAQSPLFSSKVGCFRVWMLPV